MQIKHRRNKASKFIPHLHKILSDNNSGACWREDSKSFVLYDISQLISNSLPKYFRHTNISSFIRQLNLYGFKKIIGQDIPENTYFHEKFKKDYITQLKPIRSFYNQQKFGKAKKPKKFQTESIELQSINWNEEIDNLRGTAPVSTPYSDLSYKEKNQILQKEIERLKTVEQEYRKLLDFLNHTQSWSGPLKIYTPLSQSILLDANYNNNFSTGIYVFCQENQSLNFQGQVLNGNQMIPVYQPGYCFPFSGIQ